MSWHLKNEQLEHELNKSSHPMHTFTDELNKKMIQIQKKRLTGVRGVEITFQRLGTGGVILENNLLKFSIEEIKEVPEYNPHGWNKYPESNTARGCSYEVGTRGENVFRGVIP